MDGIGKPGTHNSSDAQVSNAARPQLSHNSEVLDSQADNNTTIDTERKPELIALETLPIDSEDDFPEGGLRAWMVVAGAFMCIFPTLGMVTSVGTLQDYWNQHQLANYSARDVGWIPSVFIYLALGLGIWTGPLFDRYGPKWITLAGSGGFIVMMFCLAECRVFWQFILCIGILGGTTTAMLLSASLGCVAHWFKEKRGFTQSIAMTGASFGGVTVPLILRAALPRYGYQWSVRILGFTSLGCLILGNALLRSRFPPSQEAKKRAILSPEIFKDARVSLLTISVFCFELVLLSVVGILPTYATIGTNFPSSTGFYLISTLNGASCFGRLLPGYAADHIGRFNTVLILAVLTLILMLTVWLPIGAKSLPAMYIFTALFGFGTGSWIALVPPCIGQLCRADEFGRYYGTLYCVAGLSTLVCIPISGELLQAVGGQVLIGYFCAIVAFGDLTFILARWACLDWKWSWTAKV